MKKTALLIGSLMLIIFLAACGSDDDNDKAPNDTKQDTEESDNSNQKDEKADEEDSDSSNQANSEEDMKTKMDKLDYTEIELEVDYGKNKEYEIELEQDENETIKAKIEDDINDEFLKDSEAFNKLYPMVKKLSIDQDTNKEDAIKDVLDVFDLEDDYDEFELDITFNDGEELKFEDK